MILPDRTFFSQWIFDERLRRLPPQVQLILIFLRPLCDRYGRFEFNPGRIHSALYTSANCGNVSARDVEAWLEILRSGGYLKTYTGTDGRRIGEVAKPYWLQKLTFGKAHYEPESGEQPLLDLPVAEPPRALPRSEMKRRETCAEGAAPAPAGAKAESFSAFSPPTEASPTPEPSANSREELGYHTREQIEEPLFRALCIAEGSDPAKLTKSGKRNVTVALNQIRGVERALTVEIIERAALAYRKKYPIADLTAFALAKHWAKLKPDSVAHVPLVAPEPEYWREFMNEEHAGTKWARGGDEEGIAWADLPAHVRTFALKELPRWLRATGRATPQHHAA